MHDRTCRHTLRPTPGMQHVSILKRIGRPPKHTIRNDYYALRPRLAFPIMGEFVTFMDTLVADKQALHPLVTEVVKLMRIAEKNHTKVNVNDIIGVLVHLWSGIYLPYAEIVLPPEMFADVLISPDHRGHTLMHTYLQRNWPFSASLFEYIATETNGLAREDNTGRTPLHVAIENNNDDIVRTTLSFTNASLPSSDHRTHDGQTFTHTACIGADVPLLSFLMQHKWIRIADLYVQDADGVTPFQLLTARGDESVNNWVTEQLFIDSLLRPDDDDILCTTDSHDEDIHLIDNDDDTIPPICTESSSRTDASSIDDTSLAHITATLLARQYRSLIRQAVAKPKKQAPSSVKPHYPLTPPRELETDECFPHELFETPRADPVLPSFDWHSPSPSPASPQPIRIVYPKFEIESSELQRIYSNGLIPI